MISVVGISLVRGWKTKLGEGGRVRLDVNVSLQNRLFL